MTQSDPLAEKIKWYKRELERLRCFEVPFGYRRVYGGAYCEDATINTTCTLAHNYYPVLSGLSSGLVSGMTFQNARELVVLTEGKYLVNWSMSLLVNSSDQTIEGLIMAGALGTTSALGNSQRYQGKRKRCSLQRWRNWNYRLRSGRINSPRFGKRNIWREGRYCQSCQSLGCFDMAGTSPPGGSYGVHALANSAHVCILGW